MKSMKKLLKYVKPYTLFAILGPFLMCIEVAMDLLQPTIMQMMIDVGIANEDHGYVIKLGVLMLVSAVIGLIVGMGSSVYSTKAAVNFAADVRRDVFRKVSEFSSGNTDSFGIGKLITIATSDIASVQGALMMTLRVFVRGPLLFIGSIIIVWMTARELFPVLLVTLPFLMAAIIFFSLKSAALFGKVQKAMDRVNTKLQETLAGIRVIKAFDRGSHERANFTEVNSQLTERNLKAEQVIFTLMPITMFVVNIGIVAGLWTGAIKVDNGSMQVGVILAFINYLNIMMNGLMSSTHVLMQIAKAFPSAGRIITVLETERDIKEAADPEKAETIRGEIEFKNVYFRYGEDGEYLLKDVSFHIRPGETIGVIGSTGSGKTTLAKLIPRLYDLDSGQILIDGVDIREWPLEQLRGAISFVPQKAVLFTGTISENLSFGKDEATITEMEQAAAAAAATEFIEKFPEGFEHQIQQGASNLSGGQKQRLSMARAFVRLPKILVLDDSTSAIDALSEASVQSALKESFPDTTILLISSKISSIIHADQILVMEDGRIEAAGTHHELLECSPTYQAIYETQSGKGALAGE